MKTIILAKPTVIDCAILYGNSEYVYPQGYSFYPEIEIDAENLNGEEQVVIDFSAVKKIIKELIDNDPLGIDHKTIIVPQSFDMVSSNNDVLNTHMAAAELRYSISHLLPELGDKFSYDPPENKLNTHMHYWPNEERINNLHIEVSDDSSEITAVVMTAKNMSPGDDNEIDARQYPTPIGILSNTMSLKLPYERVVILGQTIPLSQDAEDRIKVESHNPPTPTGTDVPIIKALNEHLSALILGHLKNNGHAHITAVRVDLKDTISDSYSKDATSFRYTHGLAGSTSSGCRNLTHGHSSWLSVKSRGNSPQSHNQGILEDNMARSLDGAYIVNEKHMTAVEYLSPDEFYMRVGGRNDIPSNDVFSNMPLYLCAIKYAAWDTELEACSHPANATTTPRIFIGSNGIKPSIAHIGLGYSIPSFKKGGLSIDSSLHMFSFCHQDAQSINAIASDPKCEKVTSRMMGRGFKIVRVPYEPTVENLAHFLATAFEDTILATTVKSFYVSEGPDKGAKFTVQMKL